MLGLGGGLLALHEGHKGLLENIFGLCMAQAQRPAVQDKFGRFGLIQGFAPPGLLDAIHTFIG